MHSGKFFDLEFASVGPLCLDEFMKIFSKTGIAVALMSSCGVLDGLSAVHNYRSGISMNLSGKEGTDYAVETLFHDPIVCDVETVYIKASTTIGFSHNALNVCGRNSAAGSTTYKPAIGDVGLIRYWVDGDMNRAFRWTRYSNAATDKGATTAPAFTAPLSFSTLQYPAPGPNSGTAVLGTTGNNGKDNGDRFAYFAYGLLDSVGDEWHTLQTWDDDSMPGNQPGDSEWWASDGKVRIFVVNPKTPCLTWAKTGTGQFYTTPAKVYDLPKIHDQQTYFQAGTSGTVAVTIRDINGNNVFYRINGGSFTDAGTNQVTLDQDDFTTGNNTLEYYYAGNAAHTKTRTVLKNPAFPSAGEAHGLLLWGTQEAKDRWVKEIVTPNTYWWNRYKTGASTSRSSIAAIPAGNRHYPFEALIHALLTDRLGPTAAQSGQVPYAIFAKNMLLNNLQRLDMVGQKGPHVQDAHPGREMFYRGYYDSDQVFDLAFGYDTLIACFKSTDHATGVTPIEDYYIRDLIGKAVMGSVAEMMSFTATGGTGGMWDTARRCAAVSGALAMPDYDTPYHGKSGFNKRTTGGYEWAPFPDDNYTWKQLFVDNNMPMTQYPNYSARLGIEEANCRADGVFLDRPVYFSHMGTDMTVAATLINRFDNSKTFPGLHACLLNAVNGTLTGVKGSDGPQLVIVPTGYNASFPEAAIAGVSYLQANPASLNQSASNAPYQWGFYNKNFSMKEVSPPKNVRVIPPGP
jgi:hypothetical protein